MTAVDVVVLLVISHVVQNGLIGWAILEEEGKVSVIPRARAR
jgi:uncharacterized membrane protein YcaP (DUF421 family)